MYNRWFAWVSHLLYGGDFRRTLNRVEGGLPLDRHGPYNAKADSNVFSTVMWVPQVLQLVCFHQGLKKAT